MSSWYNDGISQRIDRFVEQQGRAAHDFLQDADILSELKKGNPKLIDYVQKNIAICHQLCEFVARMPSSSDSQQRVFKYPLLTCQLLVQTNFVMKLIFEQPSSKCLSILFSVLQSQQAASSLLGSYFSRFFQASCFNNYYSKLICFLRQNQVHLNTMLNHIGSTCSMRCLRSLVIVDDKQSAYEIPQTLEFKCYIIKKLIYTVEDRQNRYPYDVQNALEILIDVVQRNLLISHKNELMQILVNPQHITVILNAINQDEPYAIDAVRLITELLIHTKKVEGLESYQIMQQFLQVFSQQSEQLLKNPQKLTIKTLQLIEVLSNYLRLQNKTVGMQHCRFVQCSLKLFYEKEESNILHSRVDRLIFAVFQQQSNQQIINYLFQNVDIIQLTTRNITINDKSRSHFGFIVRIARHYTSFKVETPQMTEAIKRNENRWIQFSKQVLEPYLKIAHKDLGSYELGEEYNNPKPTAYSIKSTVTAQNIDKFKPQDVFCIQQAPPSLIVVNFEEKPEESAQDRSNNAPITFHLKTEETKEEPKQQPALPPSQPKSFEDYMSQRKQIINRTDSGKSRTPNRSVSPSPADPNNPSAKKRNRWQSAENVQEQPAPSKSPIQRLDLPKIHLFKITVGGSKRLNKQMQTRRICANRDGKLKCIVDALKTSISAR